MRFDEFVEGALYGEHGFYSVSGRAGRRGDFITSPEVGPLFGAVLARWIAAEFDRLGRPNDFRIVEVGAGPGTLARAILQAAPEWGDRYIAVEVSAAQRASHPEGVESLDALPDRPMCGVVIANELLDNLPFRLAVFDGGWREVFVEVGADGSFHEHLVGAPSEWSWLPPNAPHGARVPIQEMAGQWVRTVRALLAGGAVLAFDYCTMQTADLATTPWRDWLRTYRGHERGEHYLRNVGQQDLTTQVCVDQLPPPTSMCSQADFLVRWGIEALVEEGRAVWSASAAAPTLASIRMLSRVSEADSLLEPTGLGAFVALEWRT